jgi:hypothetical protein
MSGTAEIVNRIKTLIQNRNVIVRHEVAQALGLDVNTSAFGLAFDQAKKSLWEEGICFKTVGSGGRYERTTGDEGAREMIEQSQSRVRGAKRKVRTSARQAGAAISMAKDLHLRSAAERQADRAELMDATMSFTQRQRNF